MEAVIAGVPGVAISLETLNSEVGNVDYKPSARAAAKVVRQVIENGLPHNRSTPQSGSVDEILLNVNVPLLADDKIRGICLTRQGLRVYHSRLDERTIPRGEPYYWIGGDAPGGVPERGTDVGALAAGYVSVTPLQLDLTAYRALADLNTWHWNDELALENTLLETLQEVFVSQ